MFPTGNPTIQTCLEFEGTKLGASQCFGCKAKSTATAASQEEDPKADSEMLTAASQAEGCRAASGRSLSLHHLRLILPGKGLSETLLTALDHSEGTAHHVCFLSTCSPSQLRGHPYITKTTKSLISRPEKLSILCRQRTVFRVFEARWKFFLMDSTG